MCNDLAFTSSDKLLNIFPNKLEIKIPYQYAKNFQSFLRVIKHRFFLALHLMTRT